MAAKYRNIFVSMWKDEYFDEGLNRSEKLDWIYLLTNSSTTQVGIYRLRIKEMAMELGYSVEEARKSLKRFIGYGKIKYDFERQEIAILNWGKYNFINSPKVLACMKKELAEIKSYELIKAVQENTRAKNIKSLLLSRQKQLKLALNSEMGEKGVSEGCQEGEPSQVTENQKDVIPYGEEEEREREREEERERRASAKESPSLSSENSNTNTEDDFVPKFTGTCTEKKPIDLETGERLSQQVFWYLVNYVKANPHLADNIKQENNYKHPIHKELKAYLNSLQERGNLYELYPRTKSDAEFISWLSTILSGWSKYVKNAKKWSLEDQDKNPTVLTWGKYKKASKSLAS